MSDDISPNKIGDREKREIEKERDRLRHQGVGQDEATHRATRDVMSGGENSGGNNAGADAPKHVNSQGDHRSGSKSNESK